MTYENKTIEELIDLLEGRDDQIEELEQKVNETESLQEEVSDLTNQIDEFDTDLSDRESVSEKAFNAGYGSCCRGEAQVKAWLNYKIEARI